MGLKFNVGDIVTTTFYNEIKGSYCKVLNVDDIIDDFEVKVLYVSESRFKKYIGQTFWLSKARFIKVENMVE